MKKIIAVLAGIVIIFIALDSNGQSDLRLWYDHPAGSWLESVPLGNGRLGAMPDGGIINENVILNDITMWSGGKQDANKANANKALPEIRRLIFERKNEEAQELVSKEFLCKGKGSGYGQGANDPYGCYQVLGNLHIHYNYGIDSASIKPENYYRDLSLDSAIAHCSFIVNGVKYKRTYFTSFSNDVIIIKLEASQKHKINFVLSLNRPERYHTVTNGNELDMVGQLNNGTNGKGMKYIARVKIKNVGGLIVPGDSTLQIENADQAIIYISAGTDFRDNLYQSQTLSLLYKAINESYQEEMVSHIADYQKLFDRASLNLDNQNLKQAQLPTDQRLTAYAENPTDNALPVLYFQFGRYLMICSNKPGLLPPNLQGLWANSIQTPWNGDYHLDINIEMNHWPLEVTNLPMLNESFYSLVKSLVKPGKETAKDYFNSPGWVAFVITNVWGYTSPGEGADWGSNMAGSGWLCQVLWNHYAFTQDKNYLKKIYPILKGAADFYLHSMVKDPNNGWMVTAPSESPENSFRLPNGRVAAICAGPTIDNQIVRELFTLVIDASQILHQDVKFRKELIVTKSQLAPDQIDSDGRLMEWLKPYELTDPHHRHMSPLWALYPGNEISLAFTPKIAEAAKQLMTQRGDVSTGWSLAWKINLWARLGEGNHCFKLIKDLLRPTIQPGTNMENGGGTYPNLFDAHPPFQIDGNFGGTAGISEMLVQSQNGYIQFLPALPNQWANGSFNGFCVRGGGVVSVRWKKGRMLNATLEANVERLYNVKIPDGSTCKVMVGHKKVQPVVTDGLLKIYLRKGQTATINFDYSHSI